MIVSEPVLGARRGAGDGRVEHRHAALAQRGADAARVRGPDRRHVHAQQPRARGLDRRPCSPSSTEATCSPSTTMLTTMSLRAATSAGVASAVRAVLGGPALGLAGRVRPDGQREAGAREVGGHARAHDPQAEEADRRGLAGSARRPQHARILPHRAFRCAAAARAAACRSLLRGQRRGRRADRARSAPGCPPSAPRGRVAAALGDQREASSRSSASSSRTTPSPPRWRPAPPEPRRSAYSTHAQREFALERLDRRVQRVAHRDVHAARPVGVRARALAAAERLVVGEARRCRA